MNVFSCVGTRMLYSTCNHVNFSQHSMLKHLCFTVVLDWSHLQLATPYPQATAAGTLHFIQIKPSGVMEAC